MLSLVLKGKMMKKSLLLKRIWRWMNREKKLKRKRKNGLIKKGRRKKRLLKREDEFYLFSNFSLIFIYL